MVRTRILWSVFAALAVVLALTGSVDRISTTEANASLKRALFTFAVARALNGAISVAQGTELALEPAGVGVVLSVGQVLDPINDLVERFSTVMLVAASSIGLQNVLLRITSAWGFDLALGCAALWVLASTWLPVATVSSSAGWARRALLIAIFVRFALPVLVMGSSVVFATFLEAEQAAAVQALEGVQEEIKELNPQQDSPARDDGSLLDRFDNLVDSTLNALDVREPLAELQDRVAAASEHIISLIVIFVLQTILLPIGFLWLFVEILKGLGERLAGRG